jgi:hypothetical protein
MSSSELYQPCYLAEWYRPEVLEVSLERIAAAIDESAASLSREGSPVRLLTIVAVPSDQVVFGVFAADSADVVAQACQRAGIPAERLTAATVLGQRKEHGEPFVATSDPQSMIPDSWLGATRGGERSAAQLARELRQSGVQSPRAVKIMKLAPGKRASITAQTNPLQRNLLGKFGLISVKAGRARRRARAWSRQLEAPLSRAFAHCLAVAPAHQLLGVA